MDLLWALLGMAAFWCAIAIAVSRVGGWWRIAHQYRSGQVTTGDRYWFEYANIGGAKYMGVLIFTVNLLGMRVSLLPLFRPAHPPIFVPWEDVHAKQVKLWWWNHVELRFSRVPDVPFRVSLVLARNMEVASQSHFLYERASQVKQEPKNSEHDTTGP